MSVASEHPRPVRTGSHPTAATVDAEAAVIDVPASIEEHRAAVLRRRDEAERLGEDIAELSSRIQAATYQLLVMIRAFDEREGWSGFKSCAHWLNWRTGLALGAAREKVRVARALGDLPLLSGAMRRGQLSYSKVRALTRVATAANERRLLGFAECAPAAYVERLARAWGRVDRQAEATDERRRHERRNLNTWVDDDGMVVIRGRLSPEVGALVRRALEAAADRLRTDVSAEEAAEISFGQGQADALGLLAESALSSDLDRGSAGDRYQVVLHVEHWADGGATRLDNLVLLCRRHHRAVHEEGFLVRMDPSGDATFCWPDGRPFPAVPAAPRWSGLPLAPTDARLAAAGLQIGPDTATPDWHGERLDLGYAIDVLWTPGTESGAAAAAVPA